ncbi:hypothetical protein A2U01_0113739, partial [Trifolium medium]|nr:hypothetical protein [Trifolium medium]
ERSLNVLRLNEVLKEEGRSEKFRDAETVLRRRSEKVTESGLRV